MPLANEALILDLVEWVARRERSYQETLDVWRTSCPRLTIWEDANDLGLVKVGTGSDGSVAVLVTPAGVEFLAARRNITQVIAPTRV